MSTSSSSDFIVNAHSLIALLFDGLDGCDGDLFFLQVFSSLLKTIEPFHYY